MQEAFPFAVFNVFFREPQRRPCTVSGEDARKGVTAAVPPRQVRRPSCPPRRCPRGPGAPPSARKHCPASLQQPALLLTPGILKMEIVPPRFRNFRNSFLLFPIDKWGPGGNEGAGVHAEPTRPLNRGGSELLRRPNELVSVRGRELPQGSDVRLLPSLLHFWDLTSLSHLDCAR